MPPRYTVLLPTHNGAASVGHAIASVLRQTNPDLELLVVGDGCTDDTARVVGAFEDSRLRWLDLPKAPNFGYANRNLALREARGELVAFMAHDDLVLPDHLARMADPFKRNEVEWAYSRPLWVSDDGRIVPFSIDLRVAEQRDVFLSHHNSIPASCVVYRRLLHERVGMWPEEIASSGDWEMWKRMVGTSRGSNIAYVAEPTTFHFRAHWRPGEAWGPPPLHDWLDIAGTEAWPDALQFEVPAGTPAQAAASALLSDEWAYAIRAAIPAAMDALAWSTAAARATDAHQAESRLAAAEAQAGAAEARAAAAEGRGAAAETRAGTADLRAATAEARADTAEALASSAEARLAVVESRAVAAEVRAAAAVARLAEAEARVADARPRASRTGPIAILGRALRRIRVGVRGNPLFDADWYSKHYRDVAPAAAARHWRRRGLRMGRRPNPGFDPGSYLAQNPDVRASGMNPLDHYYIFGASEGRSAEAPPNTAG